MKFLLRNTVLGLFGCLVFAKHGACTSMEKVQSILGDDDWIMLSAASKQSDFCATTTNGEYSPPGSPVVVDQCKNWEVEEGWRISTDSDGKAFVLMLGNSNGERSS